jgi:hypothetical protein
MAFLRRYSNEIRHRGWSLEVHLEQCSDRWCGSCDSCAPGHAEQDATEALDEYLEAQALLDTIEAQVAALGPNACPFQAEALLREEAKAAEWVREAWEYIQDSSPVKIGEEELRFGHAY